MKDQKASKASSAFFKTDGGKSKSNAIEVPSVSLPKGGGALKGIDEKFQVNAVNGGTSFSIPLPFSPARGASPSLSLSYNSGSGNGIFGLGWSINLESIKRKTDKKLPEYIDAIDSDTYLISGAEDLVPEFKKLDNGNFVLDENGDYKINENDSLDGLFRIRSYKPRIEGLFARIERWTEIKTGVIKWRVTTRSNVTTLFGWTADSVIHDPGDDKKIFEWLPEFVFDDKGNCSRYIYRKEDAAGFSSSLLNNKNRLRNGKITYTNLYLESVLYGNKTPYKNSGDPFPAESDYLFATVFDYGEYDNKSPFAKIKDWDFRADAFSDYKAGFEIRTTRLCKRVLLYHRFAEDEYNGLVRSLNFEYDTATQNSFTFLTAITSEGHIKKSDGTYSSKKLPPVEFQYQKHEWNREVKSVLPEDLVHAPSGLDESHYQFTDLFNEGLSGILSEQSTGWFYKHNEGDGKFSRAKLVSPRPSFSGLGRQFQLADLDGDGGKQLVSFNQQPKGFFELDDDNNWNNFRSFENLPNHHAGDPNARMLDLNGDGKPDLLITEENIFTWYPSEGRKGYSAPLHTSKSYDEEDGPAIIFADNKQSIFLADMSGDGMSDIVRIRNGEICYWPNLGFGKFGSKVAMENSPLFDHPDLFNPALLRLADIDGSGTSDIIYLGKNNFSCWLNLSGNKFSETAWEINAFPEINNQSRVTVTDLLGNGVSCIVWSGGLGKDTGQHLKYVDLMNSKKPHIMVFYKNNLGKEVSFEYCASTRFYLQDKLAGNPWITKLHFPVHCISKVESRDKITGSRFISTYSYHHGYYDHEEREFRGFGMVEQTDTENYDHWVKSAASNITEKDLHQSPVLTKTWFHTGAFLRKEKILGQYEQEYWYKEMQRNGFAVTHHEVNLPDARITGAPGIPDSVTGNLSMEEWREALRACKSMTLRSEIFAQDAPASGATQDEIKKQLTPYSVATHNCFIELLQPKGKNKYAVYVVKESEAITYNYERNSSDPRITHNLNIRLDQYGNVLESASVVYPRLLPDITLPAETQAEQGKTTITYIQNTFTNDSISADAYRLRLPSEMKSYELRGVKKSGTYYTPADFNDILLDTNTDLAGYHEPDKPLNAGKAQRRLIEHSRTIYTRNNLSGPLPLHQAESHAIPYESYQLAYTPELLTDIFGPVNIPGAKITDTLMAEGKFTHSEGDNNWWIRSGTTRLISGGETDTDAQNRFYTPVSYTDPYGSTTKVKYYGSYYLFINETEDALGNRNYIEKFNFRLFTPQRMKDINGNLSEAIADELGMVKATAVYGKGNEADDLSGLNEFTDAAETNLINNFFNVPLTADGITDAVSLTDIGRQLLNHASVRFIYDTEGYRNSGKPSVVASIAREEHYKAGKNQNVQLSFEYSDGSGKVVMKKVQAEPGNARQVIVHPDNTYTLQDIDTAALNPIQIRWIGNGKTVYNNKGNVVKQYEPYFSVSNLYEDFKELVETGVTSVMYYDAAGRLKKTELPEGTFSRTDFDSWKQTIHDPNDTILESSWYKNRTNRLIDTQLLAEGKDPVREKSASDKAARHAGTPKVIHFDTLGRPVLSVDHNRNIATDADEFYRTKIKTDIEGNLRSVTDARELPENNNKGNTVVQFKYDMLGNLAYQTSMDAGQRWLLTNILGNPLRTWDERNFEFQYFYDVAHRPTENRILGGDDILPLNNVYSRIIYGESLLLNNRSNETSLQELNILGKPVKIYDTGGLIDTPAFDFKGKPVSTTRKLFRKYKEVANWVDANLVADLEPDEFIFKTETDALGRITKKISPDKSVNTLTYNQAGLLNSETVLHNGDSESTVYIKDIDYNEKGQRNKIIYGNDVITKFYYDRESFRLKRSESKRKNNDPLQDWYYTYDAVGNITHIEDKNIPVQFFNNNKTAGISEYTYDALYKLSEAKGRENDAAFSFGSKDNFSDAPFIKQHNTGDAMVMRNYTQSYVYDEVGNILQMKHVAGGANNFTRNYEYEKTCNRLKNTRAGADTFSYSYHPQHGFISAMPHLEDMKWSFNEELIKTVRQKRNDGGTPETTYYQYDGTGQRIRKITENTANPATIPTRKDERIYIADFETYRTYQADILNFERESLSLSDEGHRFVMTDTVKVNTDAAATPAEKVGARLTRYQLHNHIGSAALELDGTTDALVISYEEYHPYGTTAYQANNAAIKAAAKRYRYTGMERDEETGLGYHSARYYIPWLGRWLSADPIGVKGGINLYEYCEGRVIMMSDTSGKEPGQVLSLGRITLPSELFMNGFFKGGIYPMVDANGTRAAELTGLSAVKSVKGMEGFAETWARFKVNGVTPPSASGFMVDAALRGEGIASRTKAAITAIHINARGVEIGAEAERLYHTSSELAAIKRSVESGGHAVKVFVEGEHGIQVFNAGNKSISIASTVNLLGNTPVKSFTGARQIATALKPLRPIATTTISLAKKVAPLASKLAPAASKLAPVAAKLAPVAAKLAPAGKFLGKVAGPLGIGIGITQMVTAKNSEQMVDGGINAASSALMMSKHPVAMAAGAGLMAGQALEKTLDVSKHSSDYGIAAYEALKSKGVNDTVSLVAGGVVTVVGTPVALVHGAVDKGISGAKSLYNWIAH
jgi:RHS repeat-associated protein